MTNQDTYILPIDEGTQSSSVGSAPSVLSTLTTPRVEVDSAIHQPSGMKASLLNSCASRFSAQNFDSILQYWGELKINI